MNDIKSVMLEKVYCTIHSVNMNSLETLVNSLNCSSAAIMKPNLKAKYLYCFESYNMPTKWILIKNKLNDESKHGNVYVYKTCKYSIENNIKIKIKGKYVESVLIVPIVKDDSIFGTLELIHSEKHRAFTKSDLIKAVNFTKHLDI